MKGPNNEKTCVKCKTNKRKVKATGERKSKSLFRMHNEENKRKERDQPVEKMTIERARPKKLDGVDVHTPASKRRSKVRRKSCIERSILVLPIMPSLILCVGRTSE
eukprot:1176505-Prorocentrum_minimum.AAC.2